MACPEMKPTARSLDTVGVTGPEEAEVVWPAAPFEPSSGLVAATPLNS